MLVLAAAGAGVAQDPTHSAPPSDGAVLRAWLRRSYPSLAYVERYRRAFPAEAQGTAALWTEGAPLPRLSGAADLVAALVPLEDQHVALAGAGAGKTETLGVLFRTSTDGHMAVWRVFDPTASAGASAARPGDEVLSIDGVATAAWLKRAAEVTFGGNRRSRAAEAALELGLGSPIVHRTLGVGQAVRLVVRPAGGPARALVLAYRPMSEARAAAMTAAINAPDLPRRMKAGRLRIGTVRLGAFAPQYDPAFTVAADAAAKKPGVDDDQAMVAGFCAVTRAFAAEFDAVAAGSDVMVLDLRGNFGGFGREARLMAIALAARPIPRAWDVFATAAPGTLRLAPEPEDAACAHATARRPIVVLTDAGTRSAGELMAAWLWGAGATVAGERTIGAGGGFELNAEGLALPGLGLNVRTSGNFTVFDPIGRLKAGDISEAAFVDEAAADGFAPSRTRPFAIQAAGLKPDLAVSTTLADLRDGGAAALERALDEAYGGYWSVSLVEPTPPPGGGGQPPK